MKIKIMGVIDPNAAKRFVENIVKRDLTDNEWLGLCKLVNFVNVIDEKKGRKAVKHKPHKTKSAIVRGVPRGDWRKIIGDNLEKSTAKAKTERANENENSQHHN